MPVRTLASGIASGGAPLRSFEIDLTGATRTLSNGAVTIGGQNFIVSGVGAASSFGTLRLPLANLYADYDGSKHTVEVCAYVSAMSTFGAHSTYFAMYRRDSTGTGNPASETSSMNSHVIYAAGNIEAGSKTTGTFDRVFSARTSTYQTLTRWGMIASGGGTTATWGTGNDSAYRAAEQADQNCLVVSDAVTYTNSFGAGDFVEMAIASWVPTNLQDVSITQSASGITLKFEQSASQITQYTVTKLFVYIGTAETA